jgi:hypothetical protein
MIYDMTDALRSVSSVYQKVSVTSWEYDGVTYTDISDPVDIRGVFMPLDFTTEQEIIGLGYSTAGTMQFFLPVADGKLDEKDMLIDSKGTRWKMIPKFKDYEELGGFIQYILTKDVV